MAKRPRRNHSSAFKAKVALAAIKGGVLEILCQFFNVQHIAVWRIDYDRQV